MQSLSIQLIKKAGSMPWTGSYICCTTAFFLLPSSGSFGVTAYSSYGKWRLLPLKTFHRNPGTENGHSPHHDNGKPDVADRYRCTVFGCIPITASTCEVLYVFTANHLQSTVVYLALKVWCYSGGFLLKVICIFLTRL